MHPRDDSPLKKLYRYYVSEDIGSYGIELIREVRRASANISSAILSDILGDSWLDFSTKSLESYFRKVQGYVYVAETAQYPELYKVGKTRLAVESRIKTLNNEAVLLPFKAVHSYLVHDRHFVERTVHAKLTACGIPRLKEFFRIDMDYLDELITQVIQQDLNRLVRHGFYGCATNLLSNATADATTKLF